MRLIDADRLIEDMAASCLPTMEKGISGITGDESTIVDHINQAPTIDAVPKKSRRHVQFVPCVCGYTKHSEWRNTKKGVWFYECLKCGIKSDKYAAKTKTEAKIGWNRMIEEMKGAKMDGDPHDSGQ